MAFRVDKGNKDYLFTNVTAGGDELYGFVTVALPPGF